MICILCISIKSNLQNTNFRATYIYIAELYTFTTHFLSFSGLSFVPSKWILLMDICNRAKRMVHTVIHRYWCSSNMENPTIVAPVTLVSADSKLVGMEDKWQWWHLKVNKYQSKSRYGHCMEISLTLLQHTYHFVWIKASVT